VQLKGMGQDAPLLRAYGYDVLPVLNAAALAALSSRGKPTKDSDLSQVVLYMSKIYPNLVVPGASDSEKQVALTHQVQRARGGGGGRHTM
jgi:hypothetical protein